MTHIKYPDGMDVPVPHDSNWQAEALRQNALLYNAMLATAKAEAKLAKAVDALRFLEIAATGAGVPHLQERKLLHEAIRKARAVIAELEKAE